MEKANSNHNLTISVAKALCIILMVVGHSGVPDKISAFIYLFHMPAFFFVSGYLFNEKYFDDSITFVKKRFKGLYIPFVKYSLIFMLLHNLFAYIGLYDTSYLLNDYQYMIFHILSLTRTEQLLGGYWFLHELLYASLFSLLLLKILRLIFRNTSITVLSSFATAIFVVLAFIFSIIRYKIPTIGAQTFLASAFYLSGYCFRRLNVFAKKNLVVGLFCFIALAFIAPFFSCDMQGAKGLKLILYFAIALIGIYGTIQISSAIKGKVVRVFDYIGNHTLDILTYHFISFKFVSAIKILVFGLSWNMLSDFPIIREYNGIFFIVYCIVGVAFPLAFGLLLSRLKLKRT